MCSQQTQDGLMMVTMGYTRRKLGKSGNLHFQMKKTVESCTIDTDNVLGDDPKGFRHRKSKTGLGLMCAQHVWNICDSNHGKPFPLTTMQDGIILKKPGQPFIVRYHQKRNEQAGFAVQGQAKEKGFAWLAFGRNYFPVKPWSVHGG